MAALKIVIFIISIVSLYYGSVCLFNPALGIRIFQAWCRFINWRVEPIDYKGEIIRTRIFGFILVVLIIAFLTVNIMFGE